MPDLKSILRINAFKLLVLFLFGVSCGEPGNQSFDLATKALKEENAELKALSRKYYEDRMKFIGDSITQTSLSVLHQQIEKTDHLLDSTSQILMTIKGEPEKTIDEVKSLLANGPLGDTLYHSIKRSATLIEAFVENDPSKEAAVDSLIKETMRPLNNIDYWKRSFFDMTTPEGANAIILGYRNILYQAGIVVFKK